MKKYSILLLTAFSLLSMGSCNSWLELEPENDLTRGEFWKSKEEIQSVIAGTYLAMAENVDKLFYWGELRGGTLVEGSAPLDAHLKIMSLEISETNDLARWGFLYKAINNANEVIKYAPNVVGKDPSLSVPKMKTLQSEAYFVRALAYFYLIRVFGDVPYIIDPSDDDTHNFYVAKSDGIEILKAELAALNNIVEFAAISFDNTALTKGRATKAALYALIADINLWLEQPHEAIAACEEIYKLKGYTLITNVLWFDMFKEGLSNETIFEIQFNRALGSSNPLVAPLLFNQGKRLAVNDSFAHEFSDQDMRGEGSSFMMNNLSYEVWKCVGLSNDISNPNILNQRRVIGVSDDNGYIIYRYADVLLMEAEAQAMTASGATRAKDLLSQVQLRATGESSAEDLGDDETSLLTAILQERKLEFAFEGKRWFDVLRISKRNNFANKNIVEDVVLSNASSIDQARVEAVLRDNNSLYMPIHKDELRNNQALTQNPFYNY